MNRPLTAAMLLAALLSGGALRAANTEVFVHDSADDFAAGDITTSTLTVDGSLLPPLARTDIAAVSESIVWDIVRIEGRTCIATGNRGRVFEVTGTGTTNLLADLDEPAVHALVEGGFGALLAGASPGGTVYEIGERNRVKVFAKTGEGYIWDMVTYGSDILAATGPRGRILRIDDRGRAGLLAEIPGVKHVTSLTPIAGSNDLLFCTANPGLVGRAALDGSVEVLLDPGMEEVRRAIRLSDGTVIAAVNGERVSGQKLLGKSPAPPAAGAAGTVKMVKASFLARVRPTGFVEELWTSPHSPITDFEVLPDGRYLVAAGKEGQFFRVDTTGRADRVGVGVGQVISDMHATDGAILVGTGGPASIFSINPSERQRGFFLSPAIDAKGSVAWSRLGLEAEPGDGELQVSWRTGNRELPDSTWTPWSRPVVWDEATLELGGGVSRFLQYRIELLPFRGLRPIPPRVDSVTVFALRPNLRPTVGDVTVGPAPADPKSPEPVSPASRRVAWSASDPNGDVLSFTLSIKERRDTEWHALASGLAGSFHDFDTAELPDGEYRIRVQADDSASNTEGEGRRNERTSPPFIIDNSAPRIVLTTMQRSSHDRVEVEFRAEDIGSLLASAKWRRGMGEWVVLQPVDGVFDERAETFVFAVSGDAAEIGDVITVLVTDARGNRTAERVRLD